MTALSPAALESVREYRAALREWRLDVLADVVWEILPITEFLTWKEVAALAVSYFEETNWRDRDPMLRRNSTSFVNVNYIMVNRSAIRQKLAEQRRFIYPKAFHGIRRALNKREITEALSSDAERIVFHVDAHNHLAEVSNKTVGTEAPIIGLDFLPALPAPVGVPVSEPVRSNGVQRRPIAQVVDIPAIGEAVPVTASA